MKNKNKHTPVLMNEVVLNLKVGSSGVYVDGTVGGGGHAEAILNASKPSGVLVGIDRDSEALKVSKARLKGFGGRVQLMHRSFDRIAECVQAIGFNAVNGVIFDLGISSMQLDDPLRGFSFRAEGPLDMRMDQGMTRMASHVVNESSEAELGRIFWEYGEERYGRRVARGIAERRLLRPILTTGELKDVVRCAVPASYRASRLHCATRVFQAIRIAVNEELNLLSQGIDAAVSILSPGGRMAVISFHSLEDRIVKHAFRAMARATNPVVAEVFKKPLRPSVDEQRQNVRSRSAKLRVIEKIC